MMTLTQLLAREGSGLAAVRWFHKKGVMMTYVTFWRWCHGVSKPGAAHLELCRRVGVDLTK